MVNTRQGYKQSESAYLMRHARNAMCGRNFATLHYVEQIKTRVPVLYRHNTRKMDAYYCRDGSIGAVFEAITPDELNRGGLVFMSVEKSSSLYSHLQHVKYEHC